MPKLSVVLAAIVVFLTTSLASADPVLTFSGGLLVPPLDESVGWRFDVLAPLTVTALEYFDENGDGLHSAHAVGIWDPSGTLLVTTVIPALTAAPLVSG
jgi:hypothetical protein